jgi:predicted RNA binding protein YcfA (HicA-like mRNA interferase family)
MATKWRELVKIVENDGWYFVRQKGSHRQYKHSTKKGIVTLAYHQLSETVPVGTMINILKQAELEK